MNPEKVIPEIPKAPAPSYGEIARNVGFILITIGVAYWLSVSVGIEDIRATVAQAGVLGPLVIVLLKMTTIIVVPLGGAPVYAVAGAVFGFWKGLALVFVGDVLGFSLAFFLSRIFGRRILQFFMSRMHMPLVEKIVTRSNEFKIFFKARLVFAGLPEIFAYASGLTAVSFPLFIVVQMAVHLIPSSLIVLFGELLFTGNFMLFVGASVAAVVVAIGGAYWLHKDLVHGA